MGLLQHAFICLRPRTPYPPTYTLYGILVYSIFIHTGKGRGRGRDLNQREGERGNSSQSWVENTNMTACISTYKL